MMKIVSIVFILANSGLALKPHPGGKTFRDWIKSTKCLNMASQPLMNTQFAQLGALDALQDAGLMEHVTGLSGVSSGAFVMALAGTKNFSENSKRFREVWPGWTNIMPGGEEAKDPAFSDFYERRVLKKVLPASFEELKIPVSIVAVAYDDDKAAATINGKKAQPMIVSDGELPASVIVSSSAMMGPGCPRCTKGFSAKNFRGHWPAADGFLLDEYGTLGLSALKPCENLVHFQPQNFAQQLSPTKNVDLDLSPKRVVTLGIDIPSSGIMSMGWDAILRPINKLRKLTGKAGSQQLKGVANQDEIWEKVLYETSYDHMTELLDQPMQVDPKDDEEHYFVDLNLKKHWDTIRGWGEKKWDLQFDGQHGIYWDKTKERRNAMVKSRNALLKSGELSFKACGNGKGAPRCNALGKRMPSFYRGKKITWESEKQVNPFSLKPKMGSAVQSPAHNAYDRTDTLSGLVLESGPRMK